MRNSFFLCLRLAALAPLVFAQGTIAPNEARPVVTLWWTVGGVPVSPTPFVAAPGPANTDAKNWVSRTKINPRLTLALFLREKPHFHLSLLEVGVFNDPLVASTQPFEGAAIPSETLPDIEIRSSSKAIFPLLQHLTSFEEIGRSNRSH